MKLPRPFYNNKWIVDFFVKKKQRFYKILKWNDKGLNQSLIETGKYNDEEPKSLIPKEIKSCEELK